VLFLLDSFRDMALSWGQRVVKFLVMGPLAFLASLVLFAFTSAIFATSMPDGLKYLFITALSWLAWRLMRPHTALGRMRMPGKKLLGQVLAMKLAVPAPRGKESGSGEGDDQEGTDGEVPARQAAAARDRLVYTRARPPIGFQRRAGDTEPDESDPVVYYSTASAVVEDTRRPLGTAATAAPSRHSTIAARAVDGRSKSYRSGELDRSQPLLSPTPDVEDPPIPATRRPVPQFTARETTPQERTPSRPAEALAAGQQPSQPAMPSDPGPLEGQLLPPGQPLPAKVHESNVTYDRDGKPVFQVYRPEGSRFYAQQD
ncbi:MAG: hypothetical protein WCG47_09105, partial [Dermatophilaceae bacterium]